MSTTLTVANNNEKWITKILETADGENPVPPTLLNLLEGPVEGRDPDRFSAIFNKASAQAEKAGRIWLALSCEAGRISGLRRHANADLEELSRDLAALRKRSDSKLEDGVLKHDFQGRCAREHIVILRNLGQHDHAESAARAGEQQFLAAGNMQMFVECSFMAATEITMACIVKHDTAHAAHAAFYSMLQVRASAPLLLKGVPHSWLDTNAPAHLLHLSHLMGMPDYPGREQDMYAFVNGLLKDTHWGEWFEFWFLHSRDRHQQIVALAPGYVARYGAAPSSSTADAVLSVLIMRAQAHQALGQSEQTTQALETVLDWQGNGTALCKAVATKLMAELSAG